MAVAILSVWIVALVAAMTDAIPYVKARANMIVRVVVEVIVHLETNSLHTIILNNHFQVVLIVQEDVKIVAPLGVVPLVTRNVKELAKRHVKELVKQGVKTLVYQDVKMPVNGVVKLLVEAVKIAV